MKMLIDDIFQYSTDAPAELISPQLADIYTALTSHNITFSTAKTINCVGIGYTDATQITISNGVDNRIISITDVYPYQNGLYLIDPITTHVSGNYFTVSHNGTFIGRVAGGTYRQLNTSVTKEIGFYNTNENRLSASGQVLPGAGGYFGRAFEADVRYKIDDTVYNDFLNAYQSQIMREFPFFLLLDDEQHKLPVSMYRMYMKTQKPLDLLQSSSYRYLYSYKFSFREAY